MEVFMLKRVFFVLLLITVGCAKHSDISTGAGVAGFSGFNFEPSLSACVNGIIVAMDYACAVEITTELTRQYAVIGCTSITTRPRVYDWSKVNVIAIFDPAIPEPAHSTMICVDHITRIYLQKSPTEKR